MNEKAIVLFSGGQDSATCLAWALERFEAVETIAFDYGQTHAVELTVRERILARLRALYPHGHAKPGIDHTVDLTLPGRISDMALMWIDKAATWAMAEELGGRTLVELIIEDTHSCYRGERETLHPWGYGCGTCPACELRQNGWQTFGGGGAVG